MSERTTRNDTLRTVFNLYCETCSCILRCMHMQLPIQLQNKVFWYICTEWCAFRLFNEFPNTRNCQSELSLSVYLSPSLSVTLSLSQTHKYNVSLWMVITQTEIRNLIGPTLGGVHQALPENSGVVLFLTYFIFNSPIVRRFPCLDKSCLRKISTLIVKLLMMCNLLFAWT